MRDPRLILILFVAALILISQFSKNPPTDATIQPTATLDQFPHPHTQKDSCRWNLNCWSKKHELDATVRCQMAIESMVKFDYEWVDTWTMKPFSVAEWLDKRKGWLTYAGDSLKVQNSFGAWYRPLYACAFDTVNTEVLNIQFEEP